MSNPVSSRLEQIRLAREWAAKLEAAGFRDLEDVNDRDGLLSSAGTKTIKPGHESEYEGQAEYYRLASAYLWEHQWRDALDNKIWAMHCEGEAVRQIAAELGTYRKRVWESIQTQSRVMLGLVAEPVPVRAQVTGRPSIGPGHGADSARINLRADPLFLSALAALSREWGRSRCDVIRHLVMESAVGIFTNRHT